MKRLTIKLSILFSLSILLGFPISGRALTSFGVVNPNLSIGPRTLKVAVLVNTAHYSVSTDKEVSTDRYKADPEDVERAFAIASEQLLPLANTKFKLIDIHYYYDPDEVSPEQTMVDYLENIAEETPHYVVVFSKIGTRTFGGGTTIPYGLTNGEALQLYGRDPDFCSYNSQTKEYPGGIVYGAILDWHHDLGCGNEVVDNEYVHVSSTSFGGQCKNTPGLECVYLYDEWQCPNLIDDPHFGPMIKDRHLFIAFSINHELLHRFHMAEYGVDHYCLEDVPEWLKALSAFSICGANIYALRTAQPACLRDRISEIPPLGPTKILRSTVSNKY